MAVLPILVAPDPRLKHVAQPVTDINDDVRRLMDDMLETMYKAPGVGLAAPQIGVSRRIIVLDPARGDETPRPMRLVNPEILWASEETGVYEEGCLSLPEQYDEVVRPVRVGVRYTDETNSVCEIEADGFLATILQHEIDHLNGVLFVDHLSTLKRGMILRRLKKNGRQSSTAEAPAPAPRTRAAVSASRADR